MEKAGLQTIREASDLLHQIRKSKMPLEGKLKIHLEDVSSRLLKHFKKTADCRYYTAFYHLTAQIFFGYSLFHIRRYGNLSDPVDISNRLYGVLFEKLLAPREIVPLDYLFPWCYKVLQNIVRTEVRELKKQSTPLGSAKASASEEALAMVDHLIDRERTSKDQQRIERILDALYSS